MCCIADRDSSVHIHSSCTVAMSLSLCIAITTIVFLYFLFLQGTSNSANSKYIAPSGGASNFFNLELEVVFQRAFAHNNMQYPAITRLIVSFRLRVLTIRRALQQCRIDPRTTTQSLTLRKVAYLHQSQKAHRCTRLMERHSK